MQNNIVAIDVNLAGNVNSSNTAWLEPGENVMEVIKAVQNDGRTIVGFELSGDKFGIILK